MEPATQTAATARVDRNRRPWQRYVAEFVVIVMGITCSLLVDEWRQARRERLESIQALQGVLDDLAADSAYLERNLTMVLEPQVPAVKRLAEYTLMGNAAPDSFLHHLQESYKVFYFAPARAGYDYLRSAGRLHLLGPDTLVRQIVKLYDVDYAFLLFSIGNDAQYHSTQYFPYLNANWDFQELPIVNGTLPIRPLSDPAKLLRDPRFRQHLIMTHRSKDTLRWTFRRTLASVTRMRARLRAQLHHLQNE